MMLVLYEIKYYIIAKLFFTEIFEDVKLILLKLILLPTG